MAKCLVSSSSQEDQTTLVVFIFQALALHPAIKSYANVTDAQRSATSRRIGELMQRLLTVDCRKQTVAALKYEGTSTIESAFNVLGQAAARSLFSDPAVTAGMADVANGVDQTKMQALFKEAGVLDQSAKPSK
jgi:hypothetical protein